jgi:hypothetical protein
MGAVVDEDDYLVYTPDRSQPPQRVFLGGDEAERLWEEHVRRVLTEDPHARLDEVERRWFVDPGAPYLEMPSRWAVVSRVREELEAARAEAAIDTWGLTGDAIWEVPQSRPLIPGWLWRNSFAAIVGRFYSGKSLIALDMALCKANGLDWCGIPTGEPERVTYVCLEGQGGIVARINAWHAAHHEATRTSENFQLRTLPVNAADEQSVAKMVAALRRWQPALVVFDTVARFIGGDENQGPAMSRVISVSDAIRSACDDVCVLIVAHEGINRKPRRIRGHTSLSDSLDTIHFVSGRKSKRAADELSDDQPTGGSCAIGGPDGKAKDAAVPEALSFTLHAARGSVYLKQSSAVVPATRDLTSSEAATLRILADHSPLTCTEWEQLSGKAKTTFHRHRKSIIDAGRAVLLGDSYQASA